jgi:hypothetical protein
MAGATPLACARRTHHRRLTCTHQPDLSVVEQIDGRGWRVRCGSVTLGWGFTDRQTAEEYLAGLQRTKDDANGQQ